MLDSPKKRGDPLSDVLALTGVEFATALRFEFGGNWAVDFAGHTQIEFGAVLEGHCRLIVRGENKPVVLHEGDCYVVAGTPPYRLSSDKPGQPIRDVDLLRDHQREDGSVHYGAGSGTVIVGGGFRIGENGGLLLAQLPTFMHVKASEQPASFLRFSLPALASEASSTSLGTRLMTESLAQATLIHLLRLFAASKGGSQIGWLSAFADAKIGRSLQLMHGDRTKRWTLPELAAATGMSRSGFALRFKMLVGIAPLDYLLQWRMQRAARELRSTDKTISVVGFEFGYSSESAFSASFKRAMGCSPKQYRSSDVLQQSVCLLEQSVRVQ